MVHVSATERHDRDKTAIYINASCSRDPRQYDFLRIPLSEDDEPSKIQFRIGADGFSDVFEGLRFIVGQLDAIDKSFALLVVETNVTDFGRLDALQNCRRMAGK